jgi:hypothetical protein
MIPEETDIALGMQRVTIQFSKSIFGRIKQRPTFNHRPKSRRDDRSSRAHSFSAVVNDGPYSLLKNSVLRLILGGAAVHRCDNCPASSVGFSR